MPRTKAEYQALSERGRSTAALFRDLGASAESALSALARGDEAYLAIQEQEIVDALAVIDGLPGGHASPAPAPSFTPEERVVLERGKRIAESAQQSRAVRWIREFLPIVKKYVG